MLSVSRAVRVGMVSGLLAGVLTVPAGAHEPAATSDFVAEGRTQMTQRTAAVGGEHGEAAARPARSRNLTAVGSHDLGGRGFNADVWAHDDHAYVGTWGIFDLACPNDGTVVVDISDPSEPAQVATIPTEPGTQTNDVKVATVSTKHFQGDLLAVSNEDCDEGGARGIELWDVSDPVDPVALGRYGPSQAFDDEVDLPAWGFGVHNLYIFEQGNRAYVAAIVDFGEVFQGIFGGDPIGDVRIIDVTDPTDPQLVGDWGIVKDLGLDPFDETQFVSPFESAPHDVWVENDIAYVSYWDAGLILLDVSDPADPQFLSQTTYEPGAEGNTHVAVPAAGGNLVVVGDEDFSPVFGGDDIWGFGRIFDSQMDPVQVATFDTGNVTADPAGGDFSMHNVIVRGRTAYVSWYSDGIVLFDISQPAAPRQIAQFVPPAAEDPFGVLPTAAEMWGVYVHRSLVLGSDQNSGLWILKQTK